MPDYGMIRRQLAWLTMQHEGAISIDKELIEGLMALLWSIQQYAVDHKLATNEVIFGETT